MTYSNAEDTWSINSTFSFATGNYIYENAVENYIFYLGGNYYSDAWSLSLTLPFVIQKSKLNANINGNDDQVNTNSDISDIYIYGEYNISKMFALTNQLKIPITSKNTLFSSGKFDYGFGMAFKKKFGSYKMLSSVGYILLGDPAEFDYKNPFFYSIGMLKYFNNNSSFSIFFQGYTEVIKSLDAAKQLSIGYFNLLKKDLGVSFLVSKGLSETSADYSISIGFEIKI